MSRRFRVGEYIELRQPYHESSLRGSILGYEGAGESGEEMWRVHIPGVREMVRPESFLRSVESEVTFDKEIEAIFTIAHAFGHNEARILLAEDRAILEEHGEALFVGEGIGATGSTGAVLSLIRSMRAAHREREYAKVPMTTDGHIDRHPPRVPVITALLDRNPNRTERFNAMQMARALADAADDIDALAATTHSPHLFQEITKRIRIQARIAEVSAILHVKKDTL